MIFSTTKTTQCLKLSKTYGTYSLPTHTYITSLTIVLASCSSTYSISAPAMVWRRLPSGLESWRSRDCTPPPHPLTLSSCHYINFSIPTKMPWHLWPSFPICNPSPFFLIGSSFPIVFSWCFSSSWRQNALISCHTFLPMGLNLCTVISVERCVQLCQFLSWQMFTVLPFWCGGVFSPLPDFLKPDFWERFMIYIQNLVGESSFL